MLRVLQIDGVDSAIAGLPLRKIFNDHAIFAGEIRSAEMNREGLRVGGIDDAGHHRAQILGIREINFADAIGRAGPHQINVFQELLLSLHALAAFLARHVFRETGDDWKLQIFAMRPIENYAASINESKFSAVTQKRDGRALG